MSSFTTISVSKYALEAFQSSNKQLATSWVRWCAEKYSFDSNEALKCLEEMDVKVQFKAEISEQKSGKQAKQSKIPIPFNPKIQDDKCCALVYNEALFTQCDNDPVNGENYCVKCNSSELVDGVPECGTTTMRLATPLMEYKDSRGRKVKHYTEVLKKKKITIDIAKTHFQEIGLSNLPEDHFAIPEKVERRGRPKKEKKEIVSVSPVNDIFADLAKDSETDSISEDSVQSPSAVKETAEEKKAKKDADEAEKKAKKEAAEAEKKAKKEAAEAEKKAKKEAAEAEKKAKKEAAEAEKKAKKEAADAAEAEKKAKKEAAEAEKKAKKEAEKLAKNEAKKSKKEEVKKVEEPKVQEAKVEEAKVEEPKVEEAKAEEAKVEETKVEETKVQEPKAEEAKVEEPKVEEEAQKIKVKRIEIDGKKYLKTADNIVYDEESKEEVGTYDQIENKIIFAEEGEEDDGEEIEEEEYEE